MLVTSVAQSALGVVTISYTNENGISDRVVKFSVNSNNVGCINCSHSLTAATAALQTPFIPLLQGDKGIKSIDSVQLSTSTGGFATIVLVKPLTRLMTREQNTVTEMNMLTHHASLPQIYDDAYLNFIYTTGQASASSIIRGYINFVWGNA